MSRTQTDSRQIIERTLLDQIANKAQYTGTADNKKPNSTELKNLLAAINEELKIPFLLSESTTPDLTINVSSDLIVNPELNKNKIHSTTEGNFAGGTVTLPAADGGAITVSPGIDSTLSLSVGSFKKILIQIDSAGQLSIKQGSEAASAALAPLPKSDGKNVGIGYVVVENIAGSIQNIQNSSIFQFINQEKNLSLTIQEIDGAPLVNEVVTIKFPNDSVVDDGNGVVTIDLGASSRVVDDIGNSTIVLKPSISDLTLQSPDGTIWGFTAGNDGIPIAESGSLNPITNIKILRDDNVEVSFRVTNDGLLQAVDPADAGTTLVSRVFLDSPEGTAWELRVRSTATNFILQSPNNTLFSIGVSNSGALQSTTISSGIPENIKLRRDDLTEVGLAISDAGQLQTINPPQVGAILKNSIFLGSPDSTIWGLKINNLDEIYTESTVGITNDSIVYTSSELTLSNRFQIQNDKLEPLFSVKEFEEIDLTDVLRTGAFVEMPILTLQELESIKGLTLSGPKVTAEVFLDTGVGIRKVFYDTFDNKWKYIHDLSLVFP